VTKGTLPKFGVMAEQCGLHEELVPVGWAFEPHQQARQKVHAAENHSEVAAVMTYQGRLLTGIALGSW